MSELREIIGALQSEAKFEAAVSELGAAGIDRAGVSFLTQEEIAASCAGAVGCEITQLPRVEIGLSDDRRQVRTLATSLAATAFLAATGAAPASALLAGLASAGSVGGLAALFGQSHEAHVHEWSESQILNGGIVLTGHPASAKQFEAAAIMRRRHGGNVFASPSA
ncbi:hypothetical protein OZ411_34570 [Bradyrhizobium sp. Arg237L]|uniref:hypothetical protein n=1 Tax=Bradyrhizobium sp. Arg237L TaxID=3003352 RepID=UPI00249EFCD9|nr:hypothetical protein [Bradyrhizobium sp. Arg237L]MDI4237939.1 hypothetical protein [Bradyrhizobium sp. Arg237L]